MSNTAGLAGVSIVGEPAVRPVGIALCLSGGGFRATFYHFGVVAALRRCGLLKRVTHIFSVSGGSILAAHLVVNWDRYCGSDEAYTEVQKELWEFGQRDLRGRILRRWILSSVSLLLPRFLSKFKIGPTDFLEREYRRFFRNISFADLQSGTPALHILATNLSTGELCSFSREGYHLEGKDSGLFEHGTLPLSLAVTASSAFPPLFPPVEVHRELFAAPRERFPFSPHFLTDGGVYDNLGFEKALSMERRKELSSDLLIVSDAGAFFDWNVTGRFFWPITRSIRTVDILMNRISKFTLVQAMEPSTYRKSLHCSIDDLSSAGPPKEIQNRLRYIRTDLDAFNTVEMASLAWHGAGIALERLQASYPAVSSVKLETRKLENKDVSVWADRLDKAKNRRFSIFSSSDWTSYLLAVLFVMIPLLLGYQLILLPRFELARATQSLDSAVLADTDSLNREEALRLENKVLVQRLAAETEELRRLLAQVQQSPPPACRDPSNGVERYGKVFERTMESGWRGGGGIQSGWCSEAMAQLKSQFPNARLTIVSSGERSESQCRPLNCPQYKYSCTIRVEAEPIFNLRSSPICK